MLAEMPALRRWMRLDKDFVTLAHCHQEPPLCANNGGPWTTWLALGGRGAGKTRLGAEWVRALAHGRGPYADAPRRHIALVGESGHDVREVMIEGPAGILALSPRAERPLWTSSRGRLEWRNGAVAEAFSGVFCAESRQCSCQPFRKGKEFDCDLRRLGLCPSLAPDQPGSSGCDYTRRISDSTVYGAPRSAAQRPAISLPPYPPRRMPN